MDVHVLILDEGTGGLGWPYLDLILILKVSTSKAKVFCMIQLEFSKRCQHFYHTKTLINQFNWANIPKSIPESKYQDNAYYQCQLLAPVDTAGQAGFICEGAMATLSKEEGSSPTSRLATVDIIADINFPTWPVAKEHSYS